MLKETILYGTTDGSGDLTVNAESTIMGEIVAIAWIDGALANNHTAVISTQGSDASQVIMTIGAAEGDNDAVFYPRHIIHDEGADVLTGTAGGDRALPLAVGKLRMVIASGGATAAGGCHVYHRGQ